MVSGDLAQVRELTVFSVQVFNTKNGTVEERFHERMSGGDAALGAEWAFSELEVLAVEEPG